MTDYHHPLHKTVWSHNQRLLFLTEQSRCITEGKSIRALTGFLNQQQKQGAFGKHHKNKPPLTRETLFNATDVERDWRLPEFLVGVRKAQWAWHPDRARNTTKESAKMFLTAAKISMKKGNAYMLETPHANLKDALVAFGESVAIVDVIGGNKKAIRICSMLHTKRALVFELLGQHEAAYMDALFAAHMDTKNDEAWCRAVKNLSLCPDYHQPVVVGSLDQYNEFAPLFLDLLVPDFLKYCPGAKQKTDRAIEANMLVRRRLDEYEQKMNVHLEASIAATMSMKSKKDICLELDGRMATFQAEKKQRAQEDKDREERRRVEKVASQNGATCDECGKTELELKKCAQCKRKQYCSRACQRDAWKKGHKEECKKSNKRGGKLK